MVELTQSTFNFSVRELDMARFYAQSRTLLVPGLLVLLAILGWGMYLIVKSGYEAQQVRYNQERTEFSGRIQDLEGTLGEAAERAGQLERTLAAERAAAGDLAALEGALGEVRTQLDRSTTMLGERARELAAAEQALRAARDRLAALEREQQSSLGRLEQRQQALGQREVDLAAALRALDLAGLTAH
jgi:chromosome segregation ATPase